MSWAHPIVLAGIPTALIAIWWMFRRAANGVAANFANIRRRWADRHGISDRAAATSRRGLRGLCLALGTIAAVFALARPQWGEIPEQSYTRSREVVLALDLSRSMLADDVSPNRLARAKLLIDALLDQLKGERVGLVVFSGTAFVQSPLSADYEVLRDFLTELDPSYLPEGGTDYAAMLRTAVQAFGEQGDGDRYLVVLSDGEALDPDWQTLVPTLRERGIRVIGLGVGTPAGALVPDVQGGVMKDEHGGAVLSHLEPATLQALASDTGGAYRDAASWVDIAELIGATVEQGRKGEYVEQRNVRLQDRFQWFLAPAVLLLLLSWWIDFPVTPLARAIPTRGRRPHPASAPVIAAVLMALAAWHSPRLASAAVPDIPPNPPKSGTASQPNPLISTVTELSEKPQLGAADYARLATETIAFASQPSAPADASRSGVIDDALAGVDRGEQVDAHAADWPALRRQLQQLKQVKKDPPSKQPNQPQNRNQQQGAPQQQSQQGQNGQSGQPDQQQGQQGSNSQDDDQQGSEGQGDQTQPNKDSQASNSDGEGSDDQHDAAAQKPQDPAASRPQSAASTHDASGSGPEQQPKSADEAKNDTQRPDDKTGEVQRQDEVQPRQAQDAGLGDHDQPRAKDERDAQDQQDAKSGADTAAQQSAPAPAAPANREPSTRMIGGGRAVQDGAAQTDTELAAALSKMDRVKDGDAPGVLFDRMNRADGQPRAEKHGKNW
jgi:Ca-activated chloride channel homolog